MRLKNITGTIPAALFAAMLATQRWRQLISEGRSRLNKNKQSSMSQLRCSGDHCEGLKSNQSGIQTWLLGKGLTPHEYNGARLTYLIAATVTNAEQDANTCPKCQGFA
jgi:hypothetical protein